MMISLPSEKVDKLQNYGSMLISSRVITIRQLAQFLGFIIFSFDAISEGRLHFRLLEELKIKSLQQYNWDFDATICLGQAHINEINWWLVKRQCDFTTPIDTPRVSLTISTDASKLGWGAFCDEDNSFSNFTGRVAE